MKFSDKLVELFLKGGQVVYKNTHNCTTILIRMPYLDFVQDDRNGMEDNKFEFVYAQNYLTDDTLDIAGYKNGGLAAVKKETAKEHQELSLSIYQKKLRNDKSRKTENQEQA